MIHILESLKAWRLVNQELNDKLQCRRGFFAAVDRRLFKELPAMVSDLEISGGSEAFLRGYEYGRTCPLAVGGAADEEWPDPVHHDYPDDAQYNKAAWISAALFCAGGILLWVAQP